ncbi:uncharacterized protein BJ171DRAFT_418999 [Polychytrium aggregatum]|uniref:uncharacterized protein n=1 Tax=Polychytrium aggregatum TaxID=110093 RepID=UPI0022FF17A1|nr:uncharacterized protein BJ171DRAFT_418999 [Polychytrium aggregatum]KAI9209134.1 hypothetical protein BJ171DRAFT_418999 [Polychytrium aggregatum]
MDSIRPTDQRSTEGSSGSRFGRPAAGGSFKGGSKAGAEASDANFYDENAAIDDASDFDDGVDDRGKQQRHKKGKGRIEVQVDSPNLKPKKGKPTQGARRQQDNDDDFDDDDEFMERKKKKKEQQKPKEIQVPEAITVANLASLVGISVGHLSKKMKNLGFDAVTPDLLLNQEMAGLVAQELNVIPVMLTTTAVDLEPRPEPESWSEFPLRAPIVTIMGHVDHGKTTLLDSLRKTSVAAGEAGGITQHIGAFSVTLPSMKHITFLDTPGHAAFTAMRRRGAKTTDIVVLVVAADDGIMPQTVEAIKHAKEAGAPIIVAINKCDKPQANPSKVKEELTRYEVVVEDYGGDVPAVEVSGLTGQGLDNLEETILAVAEMMDIRGDASGLPEAFVIESHVAMGLGNVATVLVRRGTLRPGDVIVAGTTWGKVRSMTDEHGRQVKEAGPSIPVRINGWKGLPSAGDQVIGAESEALAKDVVETRITRLERQKQLESIDKINVQREQQRRALERSKAETGGETEPETPEFVKPTVNIILKADVDGSLEAITDALAGFPSHEIELKIVGSGVGNISESDIDLAEVAKASIITFNLPASRSMQSMAESRAIPIHGFKIIYELLDHVKDTLLERLPPDVAFEVKSEADVLQLFKINTKKNQFETIAGSRITTGKLEKECAVRVVRAGTTLFEGKIKTLKHHKKDITEANKGMECGIAIEGFEDLQVGDVIQSFVRIETRRKSL